MRKNNKILGFLIILVCALLLVPVNAQASSKTDELIKKIAPDGKTIVLKGVKPETMIEGYGIISGIFGKNIEVEGYNVYAYCSEPEYTDCTIDFQSEDLETIWDSETQTETILKGDRAIYNVKAIYEEPSKENIDLVNKYLAKMRHTNMEDSSTWYTLEDLALINYYLTSNKSELWNPKAPGRALKYVKELNDLTEGTDFSFYLEAGMGIQDETLMFESAYGVMTIFYGDYAYKVSEEGIYLKKVIYIPEDTLDTKEAYIAAAQKRINDYLGHDEVKITYGGLISSSEEDIEDDSNPVKSDGNYYNVKVLDRTYKFYIAKGSVDKIVKPTYSGKNLKNDITITSTDGSIPLDTTITATKLTSGEEYEKITEKLDLTDNVTYDLKLYSTSSEKYITKLENGSFEVKLPIPEEFKDKTLYVYYISDDGIIETYTVDYAENKKYAVFNTNHFSIYTLGYSDKEPTYKVTLDANGGLFDKESTYVINEWTIESYDSLIKPVRCGYKFIGYYTDKTNGTKLEMILNESGIDKDMVFYARWEEEIENPKTSDNIILSLLILTISTISIVLSGLYLKRTKPLK